MADKEVPRNIEEALNELVKTTDKGGNMKKELKKTTTKGSITKGYFPNVEERLKMKINLTQNVTAIVTGHGKTKAYLHRFKMLEEPTCPCGTAEQTTDHGIFECETLTKEREKLKITALQKGSWLTNKKHLIRKHYRDFVKFINDIPCDKLNAE